MKALTLQCKLFPKAITNCKLPKQNSGSAVQWLHLQVITAAQKPPNNNNNNNNNYFMVV